MDKQELYDVTVLGGGPAGLYSAFYSGLREMKTKIIEFQPKLGGKLHVYPEKMIWDVGGMTPIQGAKLIEQLVEQGLTFDPTVVLNEKIESISKNESGIFVLQAASGRKHYSKTVIVAIGSGILKPKKLEIDGAERFEVSNLHYTIPSYSRFKDKHVLISGGGNSAIDWAIELGDIAKKVYVTHRKDKFGSHEAQATKLLNSSTVCLCNTSISKLVAANQHGVIERVELTNHQTGEVVDIPVDEVIISHGYDQDSGLLQNSELAIDLANQYYIAGNATSETSVEGLYAAGDILSYDGKVNLITGCFQDAVNAVNKAKQFIQPNAEKFAMVSSHHEAFEKRNRELVKELVER